MGITVAVTRVAADSGGGNQDITTADLGGLTPKAAFFVISRAITDEVAADHAIIGIGAATETDERWAMSISSEHGQADTDVDMIGMTDECIAILGAGTGAIDGEADFVTFIANGVRINWGDAPADDYLLTVTLFAGTDLSAKADTFTMAPIVNNVVDVNTVGFEPDILLLGTIFNSFDDAVSTNAWFVHGVAWNDGGDSQFCYGLSDRNNEADTKVAAQITDNYGVIRPDINDGSMSRAGEFGTFDANGFSCTSRGGAITADVGFLALEFNGAVDVWADIIDTPIAEGNQAQAGPGFTPQYVHCGVTQMPLKDTGYSDANAASVGISSFDDDDEYCTSIQDENAQADTDSQSLSDNTCINLPDDDGTEAHIANFVSFDANGWTWNFTATEGTAVKYWALAIEEFFGSPSLSPSASASASPSATLSPSASASASPSASASASSSASASPSPSPGIGATVCWGHITGVLEDNIRTFAGNWAGTGAIENAGDAERLKLQTGESMQSEMVDTGTQTVQLLQNEYDITGDDVTMKYRHGATPNACAVAAWNAYVAPFESLGYVEILMEATI